MILRAEDAAALSKRRRKSSYRAGLSSYNSAISISKTMHSAPTPWCLLIAPMSSKRNAQKSTLRLAVAHFSRPPKCVVQVRAECVVHVRVGQLELLPLARSHAQIWVVMDHRRPR